MERGGERTHDTQGGPKAKQKICRRASSRMKVINSHSFLRSIYATSCAQTATVHPSAGGGAAATSEGEDMEEEERERLRRDQDGQFMASDSSSLSRRPKDRSDNRRRLHLAAAAVKRNEIFDFPTKNKQTSARREPKATPTPPAQERSGGGTKGDL